MTARTAVARSESSVSSSRTTSNVWSWSAWVSSWTSVTRRPTLRSLPRTFTTSSSWS